MASGQLSTVLRHIRRLAGPDKAGGTTDGELLERFCVRQDEAAFAALLQRHGPLVLGVCRRVLRNTHDAEDAFQAAFLVLVCKARSIAKQDSVGSWLYGVAYRIAVRAKAREDKRRAHERRFGALRATVFEECRHVAAGQELWPALDEELNHLPEKYRAPMVLCYLEGKTNREAAQQLCVPTGTVQARLARARELLRARLTRRGLSLVAVPVPPGVAQAAVPPALADATTNAAILFAAGKAAAAGAVSAQVAALAEGGLQAAGTAKLNFGLVVLLAAGVIAMGAGTLARQSAVQREDPAAAAGANGQSAPGAAPAKAKDDPPPTAHAQQPKTEDKQHMTVTGRVLGPDSKPVAGASVAVVGRPKGPYEGGNLSSDRTKVLGQAKAAADGRFRLTVMRTSSVRFREVAVLARGGGHGLGWQDLNPDAGQPEAVVRLLREQIVRGRLVDLQGQPVAGITLQLGSIGRPAHGEFKGIQFSGSAKDVPPWPEPATTDAQGRFVIRGIGRGLGVGLSFHDDRFAYQGVSFNTDDKDGPKEVNKSLEPARIIEGQVRYGDSNKAVPNARLTVYAAASELDSWFGIDGRADANGRFRINPSPGNYFNVTAYAPDGQPYFTVRKLIKWPKAAVKHQVELKLPRGVLVRGKVTEAGSGKPVGWASVQFMPREANNPNLREDVLTGWEGAVMGGSDGVFGITVLPGPGHLLIHAATPDYVLQQIGGHRLYSGRPGGPRYYAHGLVALDLKPDSGTHEVTVKLRRGVTVNGRLVGPDRKPVGDVLMLSRLNISPFSPQWRGFPVQVRDGRFELHGCDPDKSVPVYFLDAKNKLGATVELSGKQAGEPVTVRMAPCGSAAVRVVGPDGKPVARHRPWLEIVVTPGPHHNDRKASDQGKLAADSDYVANVDRLNHWAGPLTDAHGRVTLAALIPGAMYRIVDNSDMDHLLKEEFTAQAGKTLKLPDMTLKKRPE
ncbi:MAG TPA: sigma-70 family RNA polymerase sigma factor [Gemmataceae bacterium]|jgi:RNA polymerase sigma factor (sigma-70 family)|nr:sigma-70 family RNA polymerase sigma factor [Gemmataceae bacterium]